MLVNDSITTNADSGTNGDLALGGTLEIAGTSIQGITTAIAGSVFTVSALDASSSQKGVATFNTASFLVTDGDVTIKTAGVTNTQLVNSAISLAGNSGAGSVALGGTLTVSSADSAITAVASGAGVSLQLNTVDVPHGGTGLTSVAAGQLLFGAGTAPLGNTANLTYGVSGAVETLSMGGATGLTLKTSTATNDVTLTAVGTNGDVVIVPNGTGSLIVGLTGAGLIQSDTGTALTVRGNTSLTLTSVTGDTIMALPSGTGSKVTVSGPTAADYAIGLAAADLVNKQYVDDAIATGAAAGAIKAVTATIDLSATGSTSIGAALPTGVTVLSVKVLVTVADTGTGTLQVGVGGDASLMTTSENDTQTTGMYIAETYVVEGSSVTINATVGGTPVSGSATIIVEYKVAG